MTHIRISHTTVYHYRHAVSLNPHRLMLRPRESRELQLVSHTLKVSPDAMIAWANDVSGNAVATALFTGKTDTLRIESNVELDLTSNPWPIFNIAASAINFPFFYSNDDRADLGGLAIQQYLDPMGRLQKWARSFVRGGSPDTLELLKAISQGVSEALLCTASGLVIGIPALIFYSIFRGKVNRLISEMEAATTHLMALLAVQYKRAARAVATRQAE